MDLLTWFSKSMASGAVHLGVEDSSPTAKFENTFTFLIGSIKSTCMRCFALPVSAMHVVSERGTIIRFIKLKDKS